MLVKGRERSVRTHGVEFKIRRKSGLPNLVDSFNLSLSLRRVSQDKRDVVEFETLSELCLSFRGIRPKERGLINVDLERKTKLHECVVKEVDIRRNTFMSIQITAELKTRTIIEHVQESKGWLSSPKPVFSSSVQLPKFPDIRTLPASDVSRWSRLGNRRNKTLKLGPMSHLSSV